LRPFHALDLLLKMNDGRRAEESGAVPLLAGRDPRQCTERQMLLGIPGRERH
jgi:hypothetical protein